MMIYYPLVHGAAKQQPHQIIVHSMGEYIRTPQKVYHAPEYLGFLGYSAHVLITPNGEVIRCREDNEGAYHARGFNTDTLGIEFLVSGTHDYTSFLGRIKTDWVRKEQFETGARQCSSWMYKFGIESILRHSDISPDRKVDPGEGFNWEGFLTRLGSLYGEF